MEILTVIVSAVSTALMSYVIWYLQTNQKRKQDNDKATMVMMKFLLKYIHKEYESRDSITIDELEDYTEIYEVYHSKGGNGSGTRLFEDIKQKQIRS